MRAHQPQNQTLTAPVTQSTCGVPSAIPQRSCTHYKCEWPGVEECGSVSSVVPISRSPSPVLSETLANVLGSN